MTWSRRKLTVGSSVLLQMHNRHMSLMVTQSLSLHFHADIEQVSVSQLVTGCLLRRSEC
jgi:hypothetical protein